MTDIKHALKRYADKAGDTGDLDEFSRRVGVRTRRRRTGGLAVGLGLFVVMAAVAATVFVSPTDSQRASDVPRAGAGAAGEIPYLWPENWANPEGPASIETLEQSIAEGDESLEWRLDSEAVVEAFAAEVLGWEGIEVGGQQSTDDAQWWRIAPQCGVGACSPSWPQTVRVDRLPESGAWVVTAVESDGISTGLEHGFNGVPVSGLAAEVDGQIEIQLSGFSDSNGKAGILTFDGCQVRSEDENQLASGAVVVIPPDHGSDDCWASRTGFIYAYASGMAKGGPPADSSWGVESPGLTMLPIVVDN